MAAARRTEERQDALVEIRGNQEARASRAVWRLALHPQPLRVARAVEQGQEPPVVRMRESAELPPLQVEPPHLRPPAPLASIPVAEIEDQPALAECRRDVDHVEDLASLTPA